MAMSHTAMSEHTGCLGGREMTDREKAMLQRIAELEAKLERQSTPGAYKPGVTENGAFKLSRGRDRICFSKNRDKVKADVEATRLAQ